MNLVDTSGWIEYFFSGPNASFFTSPIENTEELIVSVVCLYEVFKKANHVADEARALQVIAHMKQGRIIPVTEEIALKAALISLKFQLPMADSLIYSTGQIENADIWTQDADFEGLPGVKYKKAQEKANSRSPKRRR